jgi:hypothetical protein
MSTPPPQHTHTHTHTHTFKAAAMNHWDMFSKTSVRCRKLHVPYLVKQVEMALKVFFSKTWCFRQNVLPIRKRHPKHNSKTRGVRLLKRSERCWFRVHFTVSTLASLTLHSPAASTPNCHLLQHSVTVHFVLMDFMWFWEYHRLFLYTAFISSSL